MKVLTMYSESHKPLLQYFLETFPFEPGIELTIKFFDSKETNSVCFTPMWKQAMIVKLNYIIEQIEIIKDEDILLYSDIDVQFFGNIKTDIESRLLCENINILFMYDNPSLCMGFFACKANDKTLQFFKNIRNVVTRFTSDQSACNKTFAQNYIDFKFLSKEKYYNIGKFYRSLIPRQNNEQLLLTLEQSNIEIPRDILVHHANNITGIENKLKLLHFIRKKVNENTHANTSLDQ